MKPSPVPGSMSAEAILSLSWMRELERLARKHRAQDILDDLPYLTWGECWKLYQQLVRRDATNGA